MNAVLSIFDFNEQPVRVLDQSGLPWFVAADVCRVLEIVNTTDALKSLDEDEKMTLDNPEGHSGQRGGAQSFNIISESGLYALVFKSRKPQAKAFRKWVTAEVLPAIRTAGSFSLPAVESVAAAEPPVPRGLDAIAGATTIPAYVAWREETEGWGLSEQIRFGKLVMHMARAWGVPYALKAERGFGMLRAYPEALCAWVLKQMPVRRLKGSADSADEGDFAMLLSWAARSPGRAWRGGELRALAAERGLFRDWLRYDSMHKPGSVSRFGKICSRFDGVELRGRSIRVRGTCRHRRFYVQESAEIEERLAA